MRAMTSREHDPANELADEEEFFRAGAADDEENIPFDLRPAEVDLRSIDPVLELKMTPGVQRRRARFGLVVAAVVAASALVLVAAVEHVRLAMGPGATSSAMASVHFSR